MEPGIQLLAINEEGHGSANAQACEQSDLPLLQDDSVAQVWSSWDATWRDVHIVDARNHRVDVFNLSLNDLAEPENYETLRSMLIDAAGG